MSDKKKKRKEIVLTEDLLAAVAQMRLARSEEAERGVVSCLLQDPQNRIGEARQKIEPEAFFSEGTREIYNVLLAMDAASPPQPIDIITVTRQLTDRGKLDIVGGAFAITELFAFVPTPSHFPHYLKIVTDKWRLRQLTHACVENLQAVAEHGSEAVDESVMELVATAENRVFHVLQTLQAGGEYSTGPVPASEGVMRWLDHMTEVEANKGKIMGLTTGILELDQTTHGLDDKEGEITIIAARPGQGKTGMACVFIDHMGVEMQWPGLVFSAEMSQNQLYTRLILGKAKIDTSKAITGMFSRGDHEAMTLQSAKTRRSPFEISDGSCITTADLRAQVQVAKRKHGIRWIVVDHLHLIKPVSERGKADPREQIVEVMETLQFIKKYYHVSVLLMVQLNRETDRNAGKPPVLADLSGSASIEWYADHVLMLHRDSYFTPWHALSDEKQKAWQRVVEPRRQRSPELWSDGQKYSDEDGGWARQDYEELARVFVRKNRRGPTPEIHIRFEDWRTWFSTRMPCLNSTNSLDWQMGSYAVPKKDKADKPVKARKRADHDDDDDIPNFR
jgi:replicative DNA helicase